MIIQNNCLKRNLGNIPFFSFLKTLQRLNKTIIPTTCSHTVNNGETVFVFSSKSPFEFTPRLTTGRFANLFQLTAIKYFVYFS